MRLCWWQRRRHDAVKLLVVREGGPSSITEVFGILVNSMYVSSTTTTGTTTCMLRDRPGNIHVGVPVVVVLDTYILLTIPSQAPQ